MKMINNKENRGLLATHIVNGMEHSAVKMLLIKRFEEDYKADDGAFRSDADATPEAFGLKELEEQMNAFSALVAVLYGGE